MVGVRKRRRGQGPKKRKETDNIGKEEKITESSFINGFSLLTFFNDHEKCWRKPEEKMIEEDVIRKTYRCPQ